MESAPLQARPGTKNVRGERGKVVSSISVVYVVRNLLFINKNLSVYFVYPFEVYFQIDCLVFYIKPSQE
jgi:hypothetical protein